MDLHVNMEPLHYTYQCKCGSPDISEKEEAFEEWNRMKALLCQDKFTSFMMHKAQFKIQNKEKKTIILE